MEEIKNDYNKRQGQRNKNKFKRNLTGEKINKTINKKKVEKRKKHKWIKEYESFNST